MKLVAITTKDLPPLDRALPFPLRDATGRLLLNAGVKVIDDQLRQDLLQTPLFAEEHHCAEWQRRLNAAMDQRLRAGAALKDVVAALPKDPPRETTARSLSTGDTWFELRSRLDALLRDVGPGKDWPARLDELHARGRALLQRRADESLYHLVYEAVHFSERYSAHHAWMTLAVTEQTAVAVIPHCPASPSVVIIFTAADRLAIASRKRRRCSSNCILTSCCVISAAYPAC